LHCLLRFNLIWFLHGDSPFSLQRKLLSAYQKALSGESLLSTIYRAFPSDIRRVRVFVDKTKAGEVVYNLLMNAIKYTDASGKCELRIQVTRVQISCLTTFPTLKTLGITRL
ncbi:MAG: hypothetical protein LAO07_11275, partial [Acidobacteriia bacterium]|nr:hypothetical protein [Terriglobia bacterium]